MNATSDKPQPQAEIKQSAPTPAAAPPAPPAPRRRSLRGRILRTALPLIVLVGAGLATSWWMVQGRYIESTDNAYVQGDISVLSPRVDGDVVAVLVTDNQVVHAGEPLLRLDPRDWQARLDQALGAAAEADAAITTTERQIAQARTAIDQANATIDEAEAERVRAEADAVRTAALTASGWSSRQSNETAIAAERKAVAARAGAEAQRESAQRALAVAEAQLVQARAHQQTAQAAVVLARNDLDYTIIRAPFDGVTGNRAAQVGQHVVPGTQLLAVAPLADRLYVIANFKETQLAHMHPGQKVRLIPDIDPSLAADGHVDSLAPATGALFSLLPPENATGNFTKVVQRVPVKLLLDKPQDASWLRAGLSVTAEVDTRAGDHKLLGFFAAAFSGLRHVL